MKGLRVILPPPDEVLPHLDTWTDDSYSNPIRDWRENDLRDTMGEWTGNSLGVGPTLHLYRGIGLNWTGEKNVRPTLEFSSWTTSWNEAKMFGDPVLELSVPIDRILAAFWVLDTIEYIVYTPGGAVRYE